MEQYRYSLIKNISQSNQSSARVKYFYSLITSLILVSQRDFFFFLKLTIGRLSGKDFVLPYSKYSMPVDN